ncbi:MAG: tRNA (guanosine(37)-N1)-methyltransferase TrmD [Candidatus Cloacimonetes bacterium]|nr:tRNA (guanosine(37)-N1)-methyltransferase TrmD [Candidatus Cloacimonadota bacterium]
MRIDVLTLFPMMFQQFLQESIVGAAVAKSAIEPFITDIRDFSGNKHRQVDDYPFGGGAGMVLKPEPLISALEYLNYEEAPVVYFTPQGKVLTQQLVKKYASLPRMILLCGHYKDIDQRVRDNYVTDELSIGDYVLSGGELPAMVLIDAVARLQDGVLSDIDSAATDSHEQGILGCPHYTRPAEYLGMEVPPVLLSGNHARIEVWRHEQAMKLTRERRPDLLKHGE